MEDNQQKKMNLFARCAEIFRTIGVRVEQARASLIKIPFFNFLDRTINGMGNDGALEIAGAIAYYAVLSFFSLLLGVISVLGFLLPSTVNIPENIIQFVEENLLFGEVVLSNNIDAIINARSALGVISIVTLFFPAGAMFSAISRGVNRAWGLNVRHHLIVRKLREVAMSVSTCIFFFIVVISSSVLVSFNFGGFGLRILVFSLMFLIFLIIYKTMPGTKTYWRNVWPGAIFAAGAFEIARVVIVFYFDNFPRIEFALGTIASIYVMLIFIYFASLILIIGAEISSEYSRMRQGLPPRRSMPPDIYQH
ncbi:MAG: YihY/virulence factor BrkB family protein [Dehalococcoidia bacterium]|nr:YihY/virulence factor BrkB family protein [Dehalococcoidia bacterium]